MSSDICFLLKNARNIFGYNVFEAYGDNFLSVIADNLILIFTQNSPRGVLFGEIIILF